MSPTMGSVAQPAAAPASAPRPLVGDPKVTPRHLARRVLIDVRQSSPTQVQRHPESARRQDALAERAHRLGWPAEQVTIIDEEQGKSGAGRAATHERDGFAQRVTAVGLGEAGLILALEVSRLSRNSAEWHRLLELAALAGVLIGDEAAIYDPRAFNERLLLGLHGTISAVELHCIQARLQGARRSKAQRGELPLGLPVGLVRGCEGAIELDPDQEVQGAPRTVFEQFEALGSANAVPRFFREHGLRLPRRGGRGADAGQLRWARPSYQAIHQFLVHPAYAGAYPYGQRGAAEAMPAGLGRRGPRHRFALDELEVLIRDRHPGDVSWERYRTDRALLRDNTRQFTPSRGAPRAGLALLQGIVFCGRCGCRMTPRYDACSPSYRCASRHQHDGEPVCQSLTIDHAAQALSATFLAVVQPAAIDALLALSAELDREQTQLDRQRQWRMERARYEAERAGRQDDLCEPENRLVARELETRWNAKLHLVTELEEADQREQRRGLTPLTEAEQALPRALVTDLPTLWSAPATTAEERKRLVRCLVREVILDRGAGANGAGGYTTLRIGWKSGTWTELRVRRPSTADSARTPEAVLARIRASAARLPDERIAEQLNADGVTTRRGLPWTAARVERLRRYHQIPTGCPTRPTVLPSAGQPRGDGLVSVGVAAARLGVAPSALSHRRKRGFLHAEQRGPGAPLRVRLTPEDIARLDGTLAGQGHGRWRLQEARRVLAVTPEQLWDKARPGEVIAYRARVADHWEWRGSPADADAPVTAVHQTLLMYGFREVSPCPCNALVARPHPTQMGRPAARLA